MSVVNADTPVDVAVFTVDSVMEPFELPPFEGSDVSKPLVSFDKCSRISGAMRAYMRCVWRHHRCFQHIQLNIAERRQRAVAYCAAWNECGRGLDRNEHVGLAPGPVEVDALEAPRPVAAFTAGICPPTPRMLVQLTNRGLSLACYQTRSTAYLERRSDSTSTHTFGACGIEHSYVSAEIKPYVRLASCPEFRLDSGTPASRARENSRAVPLSQKSIHTHVPALPSCILRVISSAPSASRCGLARFAIRRTLRFQPCRPFAECLRKIGHLRPGDTSEPPDGGARTVFPKSQWGM